GILHDIGKIIFIKNMPEIYNEIYKQHIQDGIPLYMLENQHFGVNHAEVGGCIMETWGFSDNSINSIIFHHSFDPVLENTFNCVHSVYFANILEKNPEYFSGIDMTKPEIKYLQKLNILEKLQEWRKYTKFAGEKRE
ncbi:HDOD domain-containing protein, partial [Candidatus Desantisbacteria bacterium]|nr:HDOD domain-containing protein [Candidatus Desantisbacteria bacterium]